MKALPGGERKATKKKSKYKMKSVFGFSKLRGTTEQSNTKGKGL